MRRGVCEREESLRERELEYLRERERDYLRFISNKLQDDDFDLQSRIYRYEIVCESSFRTVNRCHAPEAAIRSSLFIPSVASHGGRR